MPRVSLIVPTYNEARNLPSLICRVRSAFAGCSYEVIVVDDNSPDGTADVAEEMIGTYPIKVVRRLNERGLATAVVTGFRHAAGTTLGVIDGDLQHPPELIPQMMERMEDGADVVVASRYSSGGSTAGWSLQRRIGSRLATLVGQALLKSARRTPDPLSGFFLLRRTVIDGVDLDPIGYKILLEILARGRVERVTSVPYVFRGREIGSSKLGLRQQVHWLRHLSRLAMAERDVLRFLRFALVGLSGVFVNLGLLWILAGVVELHYALGAAVSIETSILWNFTLNDTWTFRDRRVGSLNAFARRMVKFNLVSVGGLGINLTVLWLLTGLAGIFYLLSEVVGIGAAMLWNFTLNASWTWRIRSPRFSPRPGAPRRGQDLLGPRSRPSESVESH